MNKNDIKGHYTAKRALEIAMAGDHSVMLYGHRGAGKSTLISAYSEVKNVIEVDSCACGNTLSILRECTCNKTRLARWTRRAIRLASQNDIIVEVTHVPVKEWESKQDPSFAEWVDKRVWMAQEFAKTHQDMSITKDDACYRMFEMAVRRLGLSIGDGERIKRVARTIANFDASEFLKAKHVAEAVQYKAMRFPEISFA
jgi:magnesium chelatase family protein